MVLTLMADANIHQHVARIGARMQAEAWSEFWHYLDVRCVRFQDVGLAEDADDVLVWTTCQEQQILLVTNNRNDDGPDSLEHAIRTLNTPLSLPVFTIGDAERVLTSSDYAERVVDRLYRYLLDLDNLRGSGRLFIP